MANALYAKGRQAFGNAGINWPSDDIRAILIDTALYTVNLATDDFLNDIAAGARVAVSGNLANKTNADGVMDADDTTITSVTGATVEAIVIYKHTGVESTSQLIAYIDTGTNLPFTPNGNNVIIQWPSGADKIFKL